ncbi:putative bifunctional diguanylate cyclase/phosphodiesterase [Ureibacillus acetophenoni]|uniref:PAS domain S-box-containing protein/diguanylate cyclase (GGDEF)-like protein n=1 Tax=Ureibacillus acetophenoni TaxID=614649 RepID=A0A285UDK5_9BACL|nr:EAL domain-containing protein [Ureibacillus acetophenoni]SOC39960.1 PAS domain S-box-containing protein/diguanylate cyclase (GGDEF)-like protein [Ureibacillus acetophenoni]
MFSIFLFILSLIPICVGITLLVLFKSNKLSKIIFIFLVMVSFWHLDIAFLYSVNLFEKETINFFYRLFRFGSIMITPMLFHLGYTIAQEMLSDNLKKKWRFIINKYAVSLLYLIAVVSYLTSYSKYGVQKLELLEVGQSIFYFPVYGELSWVFYTNIILFIFSVSSSILISKNVKNKMFRSFLMYFNVFSVFSYAIGALNIFPEARLLASPIAMLVFSLSILILTSRLHFDIINSFNKKLKEQKQFLFKVIDLNPNYIYAQDHSGRYTLVNESFAQLVRMDIQDIIGKTDIDLQKARDEQAPLLGNDAFNLPEIQFIREETLTTASGDKIWVQTAKVPIRMNELPNVLAVSTDITERKNYEDEIMYQANHDILTGLPNRRKFNEDLKTLLEESTDSSKNAIMLLDIDRFKYINDALGHDVGDLLLIEVSKRIENLLKSSHPCGKIYRLGGDEFTILLQGYTALDSEIVANELIDVFKNGIIVDGSEYFTTPSIGISIYPDHGNDANLLIKHADTAMYYVKAKGKNNYHLFTSEMQQHVFRKMMIEKQLRTAIESDEFELYYQPIIDLKTNEIIGMESLIRWDNKVLGRVTPDELISVAEDTGIIIPLGQWILKTALKQTAEWQKQSHKQIMISINISVKQLLDPMFVESVKVVLEDVTIDPSTVVLEITESIAMYRETMIEKLNALKNLGVRLSMDDFGTGYSSLSYLNKYPLDSLKIDKSFVLEMIHDAENKGIVKTIIAIAKELNLKVIAEGVEGQEEYHFLNTIGCDYAQGYYSSPPLPANEFKEKWLQLI